MTITNEYRKLYSYIIEIYSSLYWLLLHNNFLNGLCLYVYKMVENNDTILKENIMIVLFGIGDTFKCNAAFIYDRDQTLSILVLFLLHIIYEGTKLVSFKAISFRVGFHVFFSLWQQALCIRQFYIQNSAHLSLDQTSVDYSRIQITKKPHAEIELAREACRVTPSYMIKATQYNQSAHDVSQWCCA